MSVNKELKQIIKDNRPLLSNSTLTTYMSCLRNIAKGSKLDLNVAEDFVTHYDKILEYLMTLKPSIRKTKIASIVVVLDDKSKDHPKELNEIIEKYRRQMMKDVQVVEKDNEKQELSPSQEESFIPWTDVLKKYNELKIACMPLFKLSTPLSPRTFFTLQEFVLLSCYVLIEPRRSKDYADFKIRNFDDKSKDTKDNYMVIPKNKKKQAVFVFNSYKNAHKLGPQEVQIPKELKTIIQNWTEMNPNDYLIVNGRNNKIEQNYITKVLNKIFDNKISSSMLRHIYLTHKFGNVNLEDMNKTLNNMGNNRISTLLEYVNKGHSKTESKNEEK